ncbi:hypothetical protein ACTFIV_010031 [Dictyostelium citrinum]
MTIYYEYETEEDEMNSNSDEDSSDEDTYHFLSTNSNYIQNIFNPSNNFISNNHNQNDNNNNQMNPFIFSKNNNNRLEITTTPITEIIRRQPPAQTWGIGNYEKYH